MAQAVNEVLCFAEPLNAAKAIYGEMRCEKRMMVFIFFLREGNYLKRGLSAQFYPTHRLLFRGNMALYSVPSGVGRARSH